MEIKILNRRRKKFTIHFIEENAVKLKQEITMLIDKNSNDQKVEVIKEKTGVVQDGVYAYMKGPTFETPAEIRALRLLGADAVGMSTVPEAIIAHHCGIKNVAVSCITNMAAGVLDEKLSYDDVKNTAERVKIDFKEIIKEYISRL